jgi:glycosyltransferase involved in cell wall biosynthesis
MVSGTIEGSNANDHFYLALTRRLKEEAGRIAFYVYQEPPLNVFEKFSNEGAKFFVRHNRRRYLSLGIDLLLDGVVTAIRWQANIIVGQYSACGNAAAIVGRILKRPGVKVVRGTSRPLFIKGGGRLPLLWHGLRQRFIGYLATKVIAVSDAVAKDLEVNIGINRERITILKNAIDTRDYITSTNKETIRAALGIPRDSHLILHIAFFSPEKGHRVLLESLDGMYEENVYIVFAGDGPLLKNIQERSKTIRTAARFVFLGKRKDIPSLLEACDFVVLPSLSDAFPLCLLEAMAKRRAVIATAVDGIPEIVMEGETGILVPPDDVEALRTAMRTLMSDKALCAKLGQSGFQRVVSNFEMEKRVNKEIELYQQLIQSNMLRGRCKSELSLP